MKKNYTHIIILIDRSGSMSSIKNDMEGGIKNFLKTQKQLPGKCTITAAQFDNEYELLYNLKNIHDIDSININPRGSTALIDSMVHLINEAGKELSSLPEEERPERVLFITITDGEENSSLEFTNEKLAELIKHQENKYNWQFTYLGANQDSFSIANKFGLSSTKTMNYSANTAGINTMFNTLSAATTRYRSIDLHSLNQNSFSYTKEEQEKDI